MEFKAPPHPTHVVFEVEAYPAASLRNLRDLPRFKATGVARWQFFLWLPIMMAVFALFSAGVAMITKGEKASQYVSFTAFLLPIAVVIFGAISTLYFIAKYHVRRFWFILLIDVLMVCSGVLAYHAVADAWYWRGIATGDIAAVFFTLWILLKIVVFTYVMITINGSDGFRVHYGSGSDVRWGARRELNFKGTCAKRVVAALEAGDSATLEALRTHAVNAGTHAYQVYTALHLSEDPKDPSASSYLFVKDIIFGGGPIYVHKQYITMGWVQLRHVQLTVEQKEALLNLIPSLKEKGLGAPDLSVRQKGTVLGLPPGNGGPAYSQETGSWIGFVSPGEEASFLGDVKRYKSLGFIFAGVGFLFLLLGLGCIAGSEGNKEYKSAFEIGMGVCVVTMIPMWIAALILLQRGALIVRKKAMRTVAARKNQLFNPSSTESLFVSLEEARTYEKSKLFLDDYALMAVTPGWLLIEGTDLRARLAASDLKLETVSSVGGASLKATATINGIPWGVTIKDAGSEAKAGLFAKSQGELAEELWGEIYNRLLGKPELSKANRWKLLK